VKVDVMPKGMKSFIATSDQQGREQNKGSNPLLVKPLLKSWLFFKS
jgi:hypothetical protein